MRSGGASATRGPAAALVAKASYAGSRNCNLQFSAKSNGAPSPRVSAPAACQLAYARCAPNHECSAHHIIGAAYHSRGVCRSHSSIVDEEREPTGDGCDVVYSSRLRISPLIGNRAERRPVPGRRLGAPLALGERALLPRPFAARTGPEPRRGTTGSSNLSSGPMRGGSRTTFDVSKCAL